MLVKLIIRISTNIFFVCLHDGVSMFRGEYTDHEFEDKDIGNLKAYVDKCGAPLGHCQQVVREELQNLLSHLLRECARFWREKRRRDAQVCM